MEQGKGVTPVTGFCHIQHVHTHCSVFTLLRLLLLPFLNQMLAMSTVYTHVSLLEL